MPRHHRRDPGRPLRPIAGGDVRRESFRGEPYLVRAVTGTAAVKDYRCPGCSQLVPAGRPHVVAWPDSLTGADHRRHWHTSCWAARERR